MYRSEKMKHLCNFIIQITIQVYLICIERKGKIMFMFFYHFFILKSNDMILIEMNNLHISLKFNFHMYKRKKRKVRFFSSHHPKA